MDRPSYSEWLDGNYPDRDVDADEPQHPSVAWIAYALEHGSEGEKRCANLALDYYKRSALIPTMYNALASGGLTWVRVDA